MKAINLYIKNCLKVSKKSCKITCNSGTIWITYTGGDDLILKKGEEAILKNKKGIILQGLENSSFKIEAA